MLTFVYPLLGDSEELKYSLRSLEKNVKEDFRVILIGHKPKWVKNVEYIPKDKKTKRLDITNAMAIASIAFSEFIWMSDDIFIMSEVTKKELQEVYYLEDFNDVKEFGKRPFQQNLKQVYETLKNRELACLNYTTHTPYFFNGRKMFDVISLYGLTNIGMDTLESFYFNHYRHEKEAKQVKSVKYGKYDTKPFNVNNVTGKRFFNFDDAGRDSGGLDYLKNVFTKKSKFEV